MKVGIVKGPLHYGSFIKDAKCNIIESLSDVDKVDVVLFTGGEDVDPRIYGERPHFLTSSNLSRDSVEKEIFEYSAAMEKLIIGICRGAQLLTVLSGGKLVQHVNNHGLSGTHKIKLENGSIVDATSTHHQMMYPFKTRHTLLAVAEPPLSDVYFKNNVSVFEYMETEPEVVYYPRKNALAIQPHPEYMDKNSEFVLWLNEIISKLLFKDSKSKESISSGIKYNVTADVAIDQALENAMQNLRGLRDRPFFEMPIPGEGLHEEEQQHEDPGNEMNF